MNWIAFKFSVKKTWLWLKTYWYVPLVLLYTLVLWLVFRKDGAAAIGALEIKSDSYKKQIDVINKTHEAEIKKKEELNKEKSRNRLNNEPNKRTMNIKLMCY